MVWSHGVVRRVHQLAGGEVEVEYGVHEVFFDEDDTAKLSWTVDPVAVVGESPESLRQTLLWMLDAVDRAISNPEQIIVPE